MFRVKWQLSNCFNNIRIRKRLHRFVTTQWIAQYALIGLLVLNLPYDSDFSP